MTPTAPSDGSAGSPLAGPAKRRAVAPTAIAESSRSMLMASPFARRMSPSIFPRLPLLSQEGFQAPHSGPAARRTARAISTSRSPFAESQLGGTSASHSNGHSLPRLAPDRPRRSVSQPRAASSRLAGWCRRHATLGGNVGGSAAVLSASSSLEANGIRSSFASRLAPNGWDERGAEASQLSAAPGLFD